MTAYEMRISDWSSDVLFRSVEPRDAIREYVQNAFDAIRSSRDGSVALQAPPRIDIVVSESGDGFIQIRDNGASITAERVWETLTSIGSSRKTARRQAGFRGIGRLARIAHCDRLEFNCKDPGEAVTRIVSYNCLEIRQTQRPENAKAQKS